MQKLSGEIGMCPICYGIMDIDPADATGNTVIIGEGEEGMLTQELNPKKKLKHCMKTPCQHFYHATCLKSWMNQKMECPTCRAVLPGY